MSRPTDDLDGAEQLLANIRHVINTNMVQSDGNAIPTFDTIETEPTSELKARLLAISNPCRPSHEVSQSEVEGNVQPGTGTGIRNIAGHQLFSASTFIYSKTILQRLILAAGQVHPRHVESYPPNRIITIHGTRQAVIYGLGSGMDYAIVSDPLLLLPLLLLLLLRLLLLLLVVSMGR